MAEGKQGNQREERHVSIYIAVCVGIAFIFAMLLAFLQAGQDELYRNSATTHAACEVQGIGMYPSKVHGGLKYTIETSCGEFRTSPTIFHEVAKGESYDLLAYDEAFSGVESGQYVFEAALVKEKSSDVTK